MTTNFPTLLIQMRDIVSRNMIAISMIAAGFGSVIGYQYYEKNQLGADPIFRETELAIPMEDRQRILKEIIHPGDNITYPVRGDILTVHYEGKLVDGTVFDSSFERNEPFTFQFGYQPVIQGWNLVLPTMSQGEKAHVSIPHQMAYGENGVYPSIPSKARLNFDIELLKVKKP